MHKWQQLGTTSSDLDIHSEKSFYKPPGTSYTARGLQKQAEILKHLLYIFWYPFSIQNRYTVLERDYIRYIVLLRDYIVFTHSPFKGH